MSLVTFINIQENPEWLETAAEYFSSRWKIGKQIYVDSINQSLCKTNKLPRWFLLQKNDNIIGGFGLIENDFMVRKDLLPWLCALYIEPEERKQGYGGQLLKEGIKEAEKLGFDKVYLNTDHVGYYEKYGWSYIGDFEHTSGEIVRVYETYTR